MECDESRHSFLGREKKKSQLAPEPFIENYGPLCFGSYIVKKRNFGKAGWG